MLKGLLSQVTFPPEFRITLPTVPAPTKPLGFSRRSQDGPAMAVGDGVAAPLSSDIVHGFMESVLPDLCTGLWRLRRRMLSPGTDEPVEEMKKPFRHLESVWQTLAEAGVEIRDHTDEDVPEYGSLSLSVIAYQPVPGITRERVIETIKPSVYMGDRLLQMGQVIIGTPEKPSGDAVERERT